MIDLRRADPEPMLRPFNQALDQATLVLQTAGAWQAEFSARDADDNRPLLL